MTNCFRYSLIHPIRVLLLISAVYFSIPIVLDRSFLNFYVIPVFYFYGSYLVFINFPNISTVLYSKPLYLDDLILVIDNEKDPLFKKMYEIIMIFILSVLFAFFAEYTLIRGIADKPAIEIMAIIGGNLSLYAKTQSIVGKVMLHFCHQMKSTELSRRISSSRANSRMNSPVLTSMLESELGKGNEGDDIEMENLSI